MTIQGEQSSSQRHNHLLRGHTLLIQGHRFLETLEALPDHMRRRRGDVLALGESSGQEVLVDGTADLVSHQVAAEYKLLVDALPPGLDLRRRSVPPHEHPKRDEPQRASGELAGHRHARLGDEFPTPTRADDVEARLQRAVADRNRAGGLAVAEGRDDVVDHRRAVVVEDARGAQPPEVVEVLGRRRGDHFVARGDAELDGIAADAGGTAPDEQSLPRRRGRHARIGQGEEVLHEQAAGGSRQAERQDTSVLIGQGVGHGRGHARAQHGVCLEGALAGLVAPLVHADGVADDAVADVEARHAFADFDDLPGEVAAHYEGVFDPAEHHVARFLLDPVERVDGDGAVFDDDFALPWGGVWGLLDLERGG